LNPSGTNNVTHYMVEHVLDLPESALDHTRNSLRNNGNLSSVSVLDVLRANMADPPPAGVNRADDSDGPGLLLRAGPLGLVSPGRR